MVQPIDIQDVERILNKVCVNILIPKFRSLGMNASGQWIKELGARGNEIWGEDYTRYLVNGRKPGKRPPISALVSWVQNKFGLTGQQAVSAAFGIANKIAEKGTRYYQRGGTDLMEVLNERYTLDFINTEIAKVAKKRLEKEFVKQIKMTF